MAGGSDLGESERVGRVRDKHNFDHHYRRSTRIKGYDYSSPGAYFVTICTRKREFLLGEIVDDKMMLNEYGRLASECWQWLANQYSHVELDEWVVMPNHTHSIVVLSCRGGSRTAPTEKYKTLGRLVGAFKTATTKQINTLRRNLGARIWQRNYYEHIIRHEDELSRIREYIINNPFMWNYDRENPRRTKDATYDSRWSYVEEIIYGKK